MKHNIYLCIIVIYVAAFFSNCTHNYNFSLKNTLSIFLLNNDKGYFFCIPIQYTGDYQIQSFEFDGGSVIIGDYEILLEREAINISVYLNEGAEKFDSFDEVFEQIYLEENGRVLVSKINEPLKIENGLDNIMNHYYIFIEKILNNDEVNKIIGEYEKGNVYSQMSIWYDLVIDNEEQKGSGLIDDFELHDGIVLDTSWFPPNLDFFKAKYLQK